MKRGHQLRRPALVHADRLKSIEPGCAFPKLYRVPVYKQFGSLPGLRLIVYLKS